MSFDRLLPRIDKDERAPLQIDAENVFRYYPRPIPLGLLTHVDHQLRAENAAGKSRKVFDVRREIELTERQRPAQPVVFGDRPLINDGTEIRPTRIYRRGPRRRT